MIIDCISDLHGHFPKLEGGDLLIVAGDLTAMDLENEHALFDYWLNEQDYKKKIVVGGNHDNVLSEGRLNLQFADYLCDSGTEFEGLKIWGSPWTPTFPRMNPACKAFTCETEEELAVKWALIPDDTDILVTHGPPCGVLDLVLDVPDSEWGQNPVKRHTGSASLTSRIKYIKPKLHIFGHIHEGYGIKTSFETHFINASHVNERYEPVNNPIRIEL